MKSATHLRALAPLAAAAIAAGCGCDGAAINSGAKLAQAPTLSMINDQMVAQDSVSSPILFTVSDDADPALVKVSATSKDSAIISPGGLVVSGNGAQRALVVTPNERAFGTATVTLTATDAVGASSTRTFKVNVTTMTVSFLSFTNQTVAVDENAMPTSIAGVSFTQDADDPNAFMAQFSMTN